MKHRLLVAVTFLLACSVASARGILLDHMQPPPQNWAGHVFEPRFDFPAQARQENYSWRSISFRHGSADYLWAVLDYALEGQDFEHFDLYANKVRGWYHMPWLGSGPGGREYVHGLTRGRDLQPGELSLNQVLCQQTWAIAFYNEVGGAMLNRVWRSNSDGPDLSGLPFLDNTVAVKLVFTEATAGDDASLEDASEILAAIDAKRADHGNKCPEASVANSGQAARVPTKLRLIQIDIAVRDHRASYKTGWVFGSFRYDRRVESELPWRRLRPTGLMWGNDPDLSDEAATQGKLPRQSVVLSREGLQVGMAGMGRGGRMNGVTDDRRSACSSCHMASQWPSVAPLVPRSSWAEARCWFRNVDGRYPFGYTPRGAHTCGDVEALKTIQSLDFSLQLGIALRNWSVAQSKPRRAVMTTIGKLTRRNSGDLLVDGHVALPFK